VMPINEAELSPQGCDILFSSLPVELIVYLLSWLDLPSQIALSETCCTTRAFFTEAQRKWWVFEKQYVALVDQYALACQAKKSRVINTCLSKLGDSYRLVLSCLLEQGISRQERKIIAH